MFNVIKTIATITLSRLERMAGCFVQIKFLPETISAEEATYPGLQGREEITILMQGPVVRDRNFTLETLKAYRRRYPDIPIVFSTWIDDAAYVERRLKGYGISIVSSNYPVNPGKQNILLQSRTVMAAKSLIDSKYVLKTRSDQRVYASEDWLAHLRKAHDARYHLGCKFISCNLNAYAFRPLIISDMFLFGLSNDIFDYFLSLDEEYLSQDLLDNFNMDGPEAIFLAGYMERQKLSNSQLEDLQHMVDYRVLELYWFKYNRFIDGPARNVHGVKRRYKSVLNQRVF